MQSPPLNHLYERDVAALVPEPPLRAPFRRTDFVDDQLAGNRPSIGRRMLRGVALFFIAVLIGVSATLAWQSYGDQAKRMVASRAPSLMRLSFFSTKSLADGQPTQDVSIPKSGLVAQIPTPVGSAGIVQQLEPMARDLAAVQRSLEQLAIKQDQMAQSIATLQAVEQDIKQKLASPAPRAVPSPPRKPKQPATQSSASQSSSVPPPPPATEQPPPSQ